MKPTRSFATRHSRLWLLSVCLLLGACSVFDKPVRAVVYDFGPGARANPVASVASGQEAVAIGDVDAARALDSTAMLYRLAYADAQQLQPYGQARWSMPFSQVFDAPDTSVGLVRVHATVVQPDGAGGRLLAQRRFVAQRPAPSADAAGGVRALTVASDQLVTDILSWLNTLR